MVCSSIIFPRIVSDHESLDNHELTGVFQYMLVKAIAVIDRKLCLCGWILAKYFFVDVDVDVDVVMFCSVRCSDELLSACEPRRAIDKCQDLDSTDPRPASATSRQ
jgi:hypothetical protein